MDGLEEIEFLDRGAQGDAWRIRRNGGGAEVLKVIVQGDSARVAKEIGAMKAVKSPFVMGFTEAGSLEHAGTGYPYILGEYVPGRSVGSRALDGEWPSKDEALAVGVGRAGHKPNGRRIVHRVAVRFDPDVARQIVDALSRIEAAEAGGDSSTRWRPSRRHGAWGSGSTPGSS